jgi:hypothetical protein
MGATAIFSCPKYGRAYQATQEHTSEKTAGRFPCRDCRTEVYAWSGVYSYTSWKPVFATGKTKSRLRTAISRLRGAFHAPACLSSSARSVTINHRLVRP